LGCLAGHGSGTQSGPALATELDPGRIRAAALGADDGQRASALAAELPRGLVFRAARRATHLSKGNPFRERCQHHPRAGALADLREPVVLVEVDCVVVRLYAEADLREAVLPGLGEQPFEEIAPESAAAPARDDRDRQLGRLRVDEAVAGFVRLEQSIPGGTDRLELVDR